MSDIHPITLTRYNDLDEAGLIDANQIYQIYETDEDIAKELIRTRKALDVAKERLKNTILDAEILATPEYLASRAKETLDEITALEQKE